MVVALDLEVGERPLVVVRHHLHEPGRDRVGVGEDPRRHRRARPLEVLGDERLDRRGVALLDRVEADELRVAARREGAVVVEDVGDAAAHPGGEVAPRPAEHDHDAARHVLAAVVADALDDGRRARVAHGEALAGEPAEERLAGGGPVEHGVADHDALLGREAGVVGRAHAERAAREALADVVVRVADERELDAGREPGAERLPRRPRQRDADRSVRQPGAGRARR